MQTEPLISITRVRDCEMDPEVVGGLDYTIHCNALEQWLAAGAYRGQSVEQRRHALADELRALAAALDAADHPFITTIEYAERRATESRARNAEYNRAEMRSVP